MDSPLALMLIPLWMTFVFMVLAGKHLIAIHVDADSSSSSADTLENQPTNRWRPRKSYSRDSTTVAILVVTVVTVVMAIGNSVVTMMVLNFTP